MCISFSLPPSLTHSLHLSAVRRKLSKRIVRLTEMLLLPFFLNAVICWASFTDLHFAIDFRR